KSFDVADPTVLTSLNLDLLRDDGAVLYLNGTEIRRDNMPGDAITFGTLASSVIGGADEQTYFPSVVPANLLVRGRNVLAVEIHQANVTSSDISFDLELRGPNTAPMVSLTSPANNAVFTVGANISLAASASDADGIVSKVQFFQANTLI